MFWGSEGCLYIEINPKLIRRVAVLVELCLCNQLIKKLSVLLLSGKHRTNTFMPKATWKCGSYFSSYHKDLKYFSVLLRRLSRVILVNNETLLLFLSHC